MTKLILAFALLLTGLSAEAASLVGWTAQVKGQRVFLGIELSTLKHYIIPWSQLTRQQAMAINVCGLNLGADSAARLVVSQTPVYSSDVRTLDPRTGLPNGYEGFRFVVETAECTRVGIALQPIWQERLEKITSKF